MMGLSLLKIWLNFMELVLISKIFRQCLKIGIPKDKVKLISKIFVNGWVQQLNLVKGSTLDMIVSKILFMKIILENKLNKTPNQCKKLLIN
jgi:hypothetical protein